MKLVLIIPSFLFWLNCSSQVFSKKNTEDYFLHPDRDTIYTKINLSTDDSQSGPAIGKSIGFFKLYSSLNDSLDIALELNKGKPVFLIGGSYTCPHFRNSIHFFDSLASLYKNEINFFVIYTIEAHPNNPDFSPFVNKPLVNPANFRDSVVYNQPKTYAQRKWLSEKMVYKTHLKIPVFIDSPSNQWLNTFGAMPNMAYLIGTNGKVLAKFSSYQKQEEEIKHELQYFSSKKYN